MYSLINRIIAAKHVYTLNFNLKCNTLAKRWFNRSSALKSPAEINTNVSKDVILYNYENPKFYKIMNICAISQYMFWQYMGYVGYTTINDGKKLIPNRIPDDAPWYAKIFSGNHKYGLCTIAMLIGTGTLVLTWMFTLRSVRYLVLHKGGQAVSIVTYAPFGTNRMMKVPLKNMSCEVSRRAPKSQLPIKVQNRMFYYLLDARGEFRNPILFDHTAGMRRIFKK